MSQETYNPNRPAAGPAGSGPGLPARPGGNGARRSARLALTLAALAAGLALLAGHDPPHAGAPGSVRADAALVLSGDVDYLRLARAVRLLREGDVGWLLLTGAGVGGDSAETMRQLAVAQGVPADRILVEPRATSTRENFLLSAPLLRARGFRSVALVTSASHMGRAQRAARKALPELRFRAVPVPDAGPARRVYRVRLQEWAKLAWYALRGWA